jgi:hypothetical protein
MFRDGSGGGAWDFEKVIEVVAPALIDGIEVESDSMYLVEHHEDYLHFLARLVARYRADAAGFREWVGRESGKGYVRLLPGFKRFDSADRDAAREKGRRFYRRVLWTAHEAMARCYCAAATWMWVSFCQSAAVW